MKIVAFGHRKRTGKDTLASLIRTNIRMSNPRIRVEVAGFADILKDCCFLMYEWAGLNRKEFYETNPKAINEKLPGINESPRDIWIRVGNHMRESDPFVWINALVKRVNCDVLLIKDLRFPNELKVVGEEGGIYIKVNRKEIPIEDDAADGVLKDFTAWHYEVNNDGTKTDLNATANFLIKQYRLLERE